MASISVSAVFVRSCAFAACTAAACILPAQGQILQLEGSSLTSYLPTANTGANGVHPIFLQRGVNIDGSPRTGSTLAWAAAGNTLEAGSGGQSRVGDVWLASGTYGPTEVDLALPASGRASWAIGRSYNHRQTSSGSHADSNGMQGYNWFQMSQPELVIYDADSNPATRQAADLLYIVYGADRYLEFKRIAANTDTFEGRNGAAGVIVYSSGSPDIYTYTDQVGNGIYFFGGNTSSGRADYQLWKFVDTAGNIAFVGDASTASTAAGGYNTNKTIGTAYDGTSNDGRMFKYNYTTVGVSRLTKIEVSTKTGGTWGSPTGVRKIAEIQYDYYTSNVTDIGLIGDLQLVTISTSLSDSDASLSLPLVKKKYYRYYTQTWSNSNGRRGNAHQVRLVVGYEGCRKYDWDQDSLLDDDFLSAAESDLKPYAEAYLEYVSSGDDRVASAFFSGSCGCAGGSGSGTYNFTYGQSASYGTYIGGTTYDTSWATRTVVAQPDGTYVTQYFDETGQSGRQRRRANLRFGGPGDQARGHDAHQRLRRGRATHPDRLQLTRSGG